MKIKLLIALTLLLLVLALLYFVFMPARQTEPAAVVSSPYVWEVDMQNIEYITIDLPPEGKSESWKKKEDQYWYFDNAGGEQVDIQRWGGGVPLLLSGPRSSREIAENSNDAGIEKYGLAAPRMKVRLLLDNGEKINIDVGDRVPDGTAHYIKLADERKIFIVDEIWVSVLEGLVLDPPYRKSSM